MKKSILLSTVLMAFIVSGLFAQVTPKKEFNLTISNKNINLAPGETATVDVTINRSKAYSRADLSLFVDNTLPEGVTISFANGTNPLTDQVMTISADENSGGFSKTLILKGKINRVTKGTMFKLSASETSLTSN